MVHEKIERELVDSVSDLELAEQAEDESLLRGDARDWPQQSPNVVDGLHASNILTVTSWLERGLIFSGSGDRNVRCIDVAAKKECWSCLLNDGAVLALALHPTPGSQPLLLASCMGGSVYVLNAVTGEQIDSVKAHTKYVHRLAWAAEGALLVSASYDAYLRTFDWRGRATAPAGGAATFITESWHFPFPSTIEDMQVLKGFPGETLLAVAVQKSTFLHILNVEEKQEVSKVNMNAHGDTHVSFVAKHLAMSPCSKYLLISTDGGRIIMMNTSTWRQVRNFYGLPVEKFGNPCAALSPSGQYVFAIATGGQVWVFHVGKSKVIAKLSAHSINVRYLEVDTQHGVLVTCSYDKSVKLWQC